MLQARTHPKLAEPLIGLGPCASPSWRGETALRSCFRTRIHVVAPAEFVGICMSSCAGTGRPQTPDDTSPDLARVTATTSLSAASIHDTLKIRILDVEPGVACVVRIPSANGPRYLVYDAGHCNSDEYLHLDELTFPPSTVGKYCEHHSAR